MSAIAAELAKVLREQPSEAAAAKAQSLVQQLSSFYDKAPVEKMAAAAEALARILTEEASEATSARARVLVKQLSDFYKISPAEISTPLTLGELNQQNLMSRFAKQETILRVNNIVTAVMASVLCGGTLMLAYDMSETKSAMATLKETSVAETKRIKKEVVRMDSRLTNMEPMHCCPTCGVAIVIKNHALDEVPEDAPADSSQDYQGWVACVWGACKRLFVEEKPGET